MQVAVIGGGVVGVCTAYFLAEAGHEVVVLEKRSNVAEQATFGIAGIAAPAQVGPWAAPGMPKKLFGYLFKSDAPVLFKPTMDRNLWRWMRKWLLECELDRYLVNKERMQRLAFYSRDVLHELRERHSFDYEQTQGYLELFRTERDMENAGSAFAFMADQGIAHRMVDAEGAREIEPALSKSAPLAGGLYLPHAESANCPLFTKQLRYAAQALGVEFYFHSGVTSIEQEGNRLSLHIDNRKFSADAAVVAAGANSAELLASLGIQLPLYPLKTYSATAVVKNFDEAPLATVMDDSHKVSVTRMGNRIRIAGVTELGSSDLLLNDAALRILIKVGDEWFPDAANYHTANFWCGTRPSLPDGPPVVGATPLRNLFINIGHGSHGWAMAAGSAKLVADLVSGRSPDIDPDGLTLARYG